MAMRPPSPAPPRLCMGVPLVMEPSIRADWGAEEDGVLADWCGMDSMRRAIVLGWLAGGITCGCDTGVP